MMVMRVISGTCAFVTPSGMYSILMRAIVRLTDEVLKLNANVEVKKHKATTNANITVEDVAIAVSSVADADE